MTHSTAIGPATPWGWTRGPGSRASTAACAASSAPCLPPPPPATAAVSADQHQRWTPLLAERECGRSRADSEPAGAARRRNSTRPTEPQTRSPTTPAIEATIRANPTFFIHTTLCPLLRTLSVTIRKLHGHCPVRYSNSDECLRSRPDTK